MNRIEIKLMSLAFWALLFGFVFGLVLGCIWYMVRGLVVLVWSAIKDFIRTILALLKS